jgi:hypothetical protein
VTIISKTFNDKKNEEKKKKKKKVTILLGKKKSVKKRFPEGKKFYAKNFFA